MEEEEIYNKLQPQEEEETLEPINPLYDTPYGALLIENNVLCTPTSLCTWKDNKPSVYCQLPQHTLNPVCQETNKGIGLLGCYNEPTCGGMIPRVITKKILHEKPHYIEIIKKEEVKQEKKKKLYTSRKKQKRILYFLITVICFLNLLLLILLWFLKKRHYKRKRNNLTQSRKH